MAQRHGGFSGLYVKAPTDHNADLALVKGRFAADVLEALGRKQFPMMKARQSGYYEIRDIYDAKKKRPAAAGHAKEPYIKLVTGPNAKARFESSTEFPDDPNEVWVRGRLEPLDKITESEWKSEFEHDSDDDPTNGLMRKIGMDGHVDHIHLPMHQARPRRRRRGRRLDDSSDEDDDEDDQPPKRAAKPKSKKAPPKARKDVQKPRRAKKAPPPAEEEEEAPPEYDYNQGHADVAIDEEEQPEKREEKPQQHGMDPLQRWLVTPVEGQYKAMQILSTPFTTFEGAASQLLPREHPYARLVRMGFQPNDQNPPLGSQFVVNFEHIEMHVEPIFQPKKDSPDPDQAELLHSRHIYQYFGQDEKQRYAVVEFARGSVYDYEASKEAGEDYNPFTERHQARREFKHRDETEEDTKVQLERMGKKREEERKGWDSAVIHKKAEEERGKLRKMVEATVSKPVVQLEDEKVVLCMRFPRHELYFPDKSSMEMYFRSAQYLNHDSRVHESDPDPTYWEFKWPEGPINGVPKNVWIPLNENKSDTWRITNLLHGPSDDEIYYNDLDMMEDVRFLYREPPNKHGIWGGYWGVELDLIPVSQVDQSWGGEEALNQKMRSKGSHKGKKVKGGGWKSAANEEARRASIARFNNDKVTQAALAADEAAWQAKKAAIDQRVAEHDKFKPLVDGLVKVGDFAAKYGLAGSAGTLYKQFAPPGSEFYKGN